MQNMHAVLMQEADNLSTEEMVGRCIMWDTRWNEVIGASLESGDHRIIESFELERTLKGHLVQPPCNEQGCLQLHQVLIAWPSLTLNVPRSTISLGNPFLCTGVSPLSGKMIHPSSSLKCKYRHVHSAFCWTWRKVRFIQSSYFTVRQRILLFRWGWRFIYFSLMASLI